MDIPMIAWLLAGIVFYFAHLDGRKYALAAAAVCWILSGGTGYTALVPLGCLFLQMSLKAACERTGRRSCDTMVLVVWQLMMAAHYGSLPLAHTAGFFLQRAHASHTGRNIKLCGSRHAVSLECVRAVSERPPDCHLCLLLQLWRSPLQFSLHRHLDAGLVRCAGGSGLMIMAAFMRNRKGNHLERSSNADMLSGLLVPATLLFFIAVSDMINARYVHWQSALYLRRSWAQHRTPN